MDNRDAQTLRRIIGRWGLVGTMAGLREAAEFHQHASLNCTNGAEQSGEWKRTRTILEGWIASRES